MPSALRTPCRWSPGDRGDGEGVAVRVGVVGQHVDGDGRVLVGRGGVVDGGRGIVDIPHYAGDAGEAVQPAPRRRSRRAHRPRPGSWWPEVPTRCHQRLRSRPEPAPPPPCRRCRRWPCHWISTSAVPPAPRLPQTVGTSSAPIPHPHHHRVPHGVGILDRSRSPKSAGPHDREATGARRPPAPTVRCALGRAVPPVAFRECVGERSPPVCPGAPVAPVPPAPPVPPNCRARSRPIPADAANPGLAAPRPRHRRPVRDRRWPHRPPPVRPARMPAGPAARPLPRVTAADQPHRPARYRRPA